jgi:5'-nucleotidase
MHILLTNDDGIDAPGLRALLPALLPFAHVTVFAPDHNWSAAGHTKTMHKPLRVTPYSFDCVPIEPDTSLENENPQDEMLANLGGAYTTTGAPSDCVSLALMGFVDGAPDLVVSGVNRGANVGYDVTYSGTVAAAMEAVIHGLPAIAISLDSFESEDYAFAAQVTARIVRQVVEQGLPPGIFLNVNVPSDPATGVVETAITRLGRRVYRDLLIERDDPRGRPYYWIGGEPPGGHPDEGTDIWALANDRVSITPIHLDMTAHDLIPDLEQWRFQI